MALCAQVLPVGCPLRRGGGAGFRVRGRCQAVACDIGGNGTLCRRGRCDLLRRPYCENEKSPIAGGSEGAMGFEEDFVLVMRPVSRDCIGSWQ